MIHLMFSVYDSVAEGYLPPFQADTLGAAERMFGDMVNRESHPFNRHPDHYTLYVVGKFDSHTGQLTAEAHTALANGLTLYHGTENGTS